MESSYTPEAQSSDDSRRSRFHTVVSTVARFPLAIVLFSVLILLINAFGFFNFLTNLSDFVPGIGAGQAVDQLSYMIAGRQLGGALVLLFALFYKDVRVMQLAWVIAIIRELVDLSLAGNSTGMFWFVIVLLVAEVATVIHLERIARGKTHA